jgi:AcrR family transcriptional regulator
MSVQSTDGIEMAAPTTRETQAQKRRTQLIDVALRLFAEQGMERTSIKDIAAAADVAPGLLYHYFRSKEDLLWAIIERHNPLAEMREVFVGADERPARELLLMLGRRAYEVMAARQDLLRVIVHEALGRPEMQRRIHALQKIGIGMLMDYLDVRIAAGELRPHNTQVTARMLVGAVMALRLSGAPADYIPEIVDNLLRGIGA